MTNDDDWLQRADFLRNDSSLSDFDSGQIMLHYFVRLLPSWELTLSFGLCLSITQSHYR